MTHETDGVNAYEYMYGWLDRQAYTMGYDDGAYRLEQMPHMDYNQQTCQMAEDIGATTVPYTQVKKYMKGWADGYSNQEPSNRQ